MLQLSKGGMAKQVKYGWGNLGFQMQKVWYKWGV